MVTAPNFAPQRHSVGFTLVEVMISITIGLIILAAVMSLLVSTRKAYNVQDRLARIQENGRFAMNFLMQDIRAAYHIGCLPRVKSDELLPPNGKANSRLAITLNNTIKAATAGGTLDDIPFTYRLDIPIEGYHGTLPPATPVMTNWAPSASTDWPLSKSPGSSGGPKVDADMLALRTVDVATQAFLTEKMTAPFSDLKVNDVTNYQKKDIVVVTDCESMSITQLTDVVRDTAPATSGTLQHAKMKTAEITPGNATAKLAKAYGSESSSDLPNNAAGQPELRALKVFKFAVHRYFIADNSAGVPSLFRDTNGSNAQELVEGIEDMQITYGVDTNPSNDNDPTPGIGVLPNQYFTADKVPTDMWSRVVSMRIGILARSATAADPNVKSSNTYNVNGKTTNSFNDGIDRRVYTSTIQLRNFRPYQ